MNQIKVKSSPRWLKHRLLYILVNVTVHTHNWILMTCTQEGRALYTPVYFWLNFVFSVSTGGWRAYRQNKAGPVEGSGVQCVLGARRVSGSERGGGGGKTEGGGERERAGVSTHHAPRISYLKFSRSAPQKNLPTLPTRTHQGAHVGGRTVLWRKRRLRSSSDSRATAGSLSGAVFHFSSSPGKFCH